MQWKKLQERAHGLAGASSYKGGMKEGYVTVFVCIHALMHLSVPVLILQGGERDADREIERYVHICWIRSKKLKKNPAVKL